MWSIYYELHSHRAKIPLTSKHTRCGHLLWPTTYKFKDGSSYEYSVSHGFGRDVLKEYSETMQKENLGHGFYYSFTNNFYCNVDKTKVPVHRNETKAYWSPALHQYLFFNTLRAFRCSQPVPYCQNKKTLPKMNSKVWLNTTLKNYGVSMGR